MRTCNVQRTCARIYTCMHRKPVRYMCVYVYMYIYIIYIYIYIKHVYEHIHIQILTNAESELVP